jgi:hypothetical protein
MVIEEFKGDLGNFKNLTAESPDDALGRQQIIALHAVLVRQKSDSDHDAPQIKSTMTRKTSQGDAEQQRGPLL